jgi:hypothetical protein
VPDHALRQEVSELTALLRDDASFESFRAQVIAHELDPARTLMAGLMEFADGVVPGKDGFAAAAFVSSEGEVFSSELTRTGALVEWARVDDVDALARSTFPAVKAAIEASTD